MATDKAKVHQSVVKGHPIVAVIEELLRAISPHVPRGHMFMIAVEGPDGISTCGGNGAVADTFALAVTSARSLLIATPDLVQTMAVPGRGRA